MIDVAIIIGSTRHEDTLTTLLDQVIAWGATLKALRKGERNGA
jgi:hypothetical protein